jgi:Domain of unknown function (DUF4397)
LPGIPSKIKTAMRTPRIITEAVRQNGRRRVSFPLFAASAALSLVASFVLAGCQSVAGNSSVSLLRVIDASENAPPINVYVNGKLFAGNMAQGNFTNYGIFGPTENAPIKVTAVTNTTALVSSNTALRSGTSQSALVSDLNAQYQVTVLEDQSTPAPTGHSEFRILNQAPSTGPIDVYFLPGTSQTVFDTAKAVITGLPVGATSGYVDIPSSTLYMVIAPSGTPLTINTTTIYTSAAFALVGGEVRTVLIVDPVLATQPVVVYVANDVN